MPESTRHCISGAHVRPSDNEPEQRREDMGKWSSGLRSGGTGVEGS